MQRVAMFIALAIFGLVLCFLGAFVMFPVNMMLILFGGMLPFMAVMQMVGYAKAKGFLPMFRDLKENEEYDWIPDKHNRLKLVIMENVHKDQLFHKKLGLFEDKGTTFTFGKYPMGFCFPESGYKVDIPTQEYFSFLEKNEDLSDWDDCVREYLGDDKYKIFCQKFRTKTRPEIDDINAELTWLIEQKKVNNPLEVMIHGHKLDFRNRAKHLKYTYDPTSNENATERERIWAMKEGMDYRERQDQKYLGMAKAIAIVLIVIMIVVITLASVDLSNFMGMFG